MYPFAWLEFLKPRSVGVVLQNSHAETVGSISPGTTIENKWLSEIILSKNGISFFNIINTLIVIDSQQVLIYHAGSGDVGTNPTFSTINKIQWKWFQNLGEL